MKKSSAFTLIELVAVIVILGIVSLIVAPLILNTIRKVKINAYKRSVDGYGRAAEYAMSDYEVKHLPYPKEFDELKNNLGYGSSNSVTDSVPLWSYDSRYSCWTMSGYGNGENMWYIKKMED